ncbi:pyruvate carboxylase [Elasticomyces elasticus]|nr:pyruvate carboxylase [Elasticomyces elasticus]KAK4975344.1 Alpha subunit of the F1 sector of mitochondrial F1F0 ATP synthase [Elasticomyces elasticus]
MDDLRELVDEYSMDMITIDAPSWYINPEFKVVLAEEFTAITSTTPLTFAPGLLDVLQSDTPPSMSFFDSLPTPGSKVWAVYAVVLKKAGCPDQLGIGSGTRVTGGAKARTNNYSNRTHAQLPRFVRMAYDQGYHLSHVGMLCWTPIPLPALVPRARLYFLSLESVFHCVFYSTYPKSMDDHWTDMMPWPREAIPWGALNSHLPLMEGIGELLKATPKQLEAMATDRKARTKARTAKLSRQELYQRERGADRDAYLARARRETAAWKARNPEKVARQHAEQIARNKSSRRFYCKPCDKPFGDVTGLNVHLTSNLHKRKVAVANGEAVTPQSSSAARQRTLRVAARAEKRFYCAICNHFATGPRRLEIHKETARHKKKVAAAAIVAHDPAS